MNHMRQRGVKGSRRRRQKVTGKAIPCGIGQGGHHGLGWADGSTMDHCHSIGLVNIEQQALS